MRIRKQALGTRNICGAKIEQRRKAIGMKQKDLLTQLQIKGIDLNASGLLIKTLSPGVFDIQSVPYFWYAY